jgi:hypothetical protein
LVIMFSLSSLAACDDGAPFAGGYRTSFVYGADCAPGIFIELTTARFPSHSDKPFLVHGDFIPEVRGQTGWSSDENSIALDALSATATDGSRSWDLDATTLTYMPATQEISGTFTVHQHAAIDGSCGVDVRLDFVAP